MTSTWIQSAPASVTAWTSSKSRPKSQARIEGAITVSSIVMSDARTARRKSRRYRGDVGISVRRNPSGSATVLTSSGTASFANRRHEMRAIRARSVWRFPRSLRRAPCRYCRRAYLPGLNTVAALPDERPAGSRLRRAGSPGLTRHFASGLRRSVPSPEQGASTRIRSKPPSGASFARERVASWATVRIPVSPSRRTARCTRSSLRVWRSTATTDPEGADPLCDSRRLAARCRAKIEHTVHRAAGRAMPTTSCDALVLYGKAPREKALNLEPGSPCVRARFRPSRIDRRWRLENSRADPAVARLRRLARYLCESSTAAGSLHAPLRVRQRPRPRSVRSSVRRAIVAARSAWIRCAVGSSWTEGSTIFSCSTRESAQDGN